MTDLFTYAEQRRRPPLTMTEAKFLAFDAEHPEVWRLFVQFTDELIRRGYQHHSADAVLHRVRWETDAGSDDGVKINNDFAAFYARKYHRAHPRHAGFFRTRRSLADREAA